MNEFILKIKLKSDAVFGRGDGVAGLVDMEVQHDEFGCPFMNGRTLRGLLVEECANILYALELQERGIEWKKTAQSLFGNPGSTTADMAVLHIGDARLPKNLRQAVKAGIIKGSFSSQEIFHSLTAIDSQTAMDAGSGAPKEGSLRTSRVILRETFFLSHLVFLGEPAEKELAFLAACIKSLRRAGSNRNRGRGELQAWLLDLAGNDLTENCLQVFANQLEGKE